MELKPGGSEHRELSLALSTKLKMADFCDMAAFDQMLKYWSVSTGLATVAIGNDGKYISGYYNFTDFCEKLTRKTPEGLRRCTECDKNGIGTYICHAGLVDFAVPITLEDGRVLGNLLGGQVLPQDPDEAKFRATARELEIDEEVYLAALRDVNVRTPEEIEAAAHLLANIVNNFVRSSYADKQSATLLLTREDIIASFSKQFFDAYYIDLVADAYVELDATEELHALNGNGSKASVVLQRGCEKFALPQYVKEMQKFVNLATLPTRLAKRQSISYEFERRELGWCRVMFLVARRDLNGVVTNVVYATQVVQEEKAKELQLLANLKQTTTDAVRANLVKTDFLARMSHDMRTPLTTISGLCDLAQTRYTQPEVLEDFHTIKDSSEYLLALVSDVLDMQKLSSGTIALNPVLTKPGETALAIKDIISTAAAAKNIRLVTEFPSQETATFYKLDTKRVRQIFINLLNNAVKYTPNGGEIKWHIELASKTAGKVVLVHTIADNGIGMSEQFMTNMYEPFVQAGNGQESNGHGLGLAIVKKLVDLMGGTITCQSKLGQGTTFTVTLSCAVASAHECAAYQQSRQDWTGKQQFTSCHVLVCEDNKINATIIQRLLKTKDITAEHASDGCAAVRMAQARSYDAILMDIMMPHLDGYAAARKIREFDKQVPIIALSANSFPEDMDKSLAAGMNAHLSKPIDTEKMFATLYSLLARQ